MLKTALPSTIQAAWTIHHTKRHLTQPLMSLTTKKINISCSAWIRVPSDTSRALATGTYGIFKRLAQATVDSILSAHSDDHSRKLDEIDISMRGHGDMCGAGQSNVGIDEVFEELGSRSFRIEREVRDDRRDLFIWTEKFHGSKASSVDLPHALEKIFRRIWPAGKDEQSDWRKEWSSWPLQ